MRWGIGIITCERFGYLRKCIESLYYYNPELKKVPLIIGDDASAHGVVDLMKRYWPDAFISHFTDRAGCSRNIQRVFEIAEERFNLDYLFFSVNDYECTRKIDFKALLKFMEEMSEAGQIQFCHWKGHIGDKKRERANKNWTTGKPLKIVNEFKCGREILIEGNFSYVNLPAITRLNVCDITKGTIGLEGSGDAFAQKVELMWVKNWHDTGLKNYEVQGQPFISLDIDITNRTKDLKV